MANPFDDQKPIEGVKRILAVASGKGGVGKSTVTANLALALAKKGRKVGLLDCDIYGPSIPRMFGAINIKPEVNENNKIVPLERLGIKLMSIGFLVEESTAVVWRGPMLFKAIDQFFRDVLWGELDDLLLDLPPGTGDVQLTIAQKVPVDGAITVTTPQNVALSDVIKSIDMFKTVNVPVLGVVENMAYFRKDDSDERIEMFPKGNLNEYLQSRDIRILGEIPFHSAVAKSGEIGLPVVESYPDSIEAKVFAKLADELT